MATSPYVELKDKHGNDLYYGQIGDLLIPPFPTIKDFRRHARDVRNMELNPNDIIIVGFPKTGTHWNFEIIHMLMNASTEYNKASEMMSFLDMTPISEKNMGSSDKPRLLFSHFKYHQLPKQVWEKKVKLVYVERNPKDTWVSMYNQVHGHKGALAYEGSWNHFYDHMMSLGHWYGDWFDYVLHWERFMETQTELSIFTNSFEDLKRDPVGRIMKLDQFLGYNRGRELCEQIAAACNFTKMKVVKDSSMPEEQKKTIFKENATGFYRKGQVGDWKNWFTVAQDEQFDQVYKQRMEGSKLKYTFVQDD